MPQHQIALGIDLSDLSAGLDDPSGSNRSPRRKSGRTRTLVVKTRFFQVAKLGNKETECEDAFAVYETSATRQHFAVADGATEGFRSRTWARLLCQHFVEHSQFRTWTNNWLSVPSNEFRSQFSIADLPWFAQEKAGAGGFSSLIGLTLDLKTDQYRVRSIGDTCLAVVTAAGDADIFPSRFHDPMEFEQRPVLVASNPARNAEIASAQANCQSALPEDIATFFLMTDAIAQWFSRSLSQGARPWEALLALDSDEDFSQFVESKRASRDLRNDDSTLVVIQTDRK